MDDEASAQPDSKYRLFVGIDIAKTTMSVVPLTTANAKPKVWTIQQEQKDYR